MKCPECGGKKTVRVPESIVCINEGCRCHGESFALDGAFFTPAELAAAKKMMKDLRFDIRIAKAARLAKDYPEEIQQKLNIWDELETSGPVVAVLAKKIKVGEL